LVEETMNMLFCAAMFEIMEGCMYIIEKVIDIIAGSLIRDNANVHQNNNVILKKNKKSNN